MPNQFEPDEVQTANSEGNGFDDFSNHYGNQIEDIKDVRAHVEEEADNEESTDHRFPTRALPSSDDSGVDSKLFPSNVMIGLSLSVLLYSLT